MHCWRLMVDSHRPQTHRRTDLPWTISGRLAAILHVFQLGTPSIELESTQERWAIESCGNKISGMNSLMKGVLKPLGIRLGSSQDSPL